MERYLENEDSEVQISVVLGLLERGRQRGERGEFEVEIADCNRLIDRYRAKREGQLLTLVVMAMESRSSRLAKIGIFSPGN